MVVGAVHRRRTLVRRKAARYVRAGIRLGTNRLRRRVRTACRGAWLLPRQRRTIVRIPSQCPIVTHVAPISPAKRTLPQAPTPSTSSRNQDRTEL
jgi:hypothetical protein